MEITPEFVNSLLAKIEDLTLEYSRLKEENKQLRLKITELESKIDRLTRNSQNSSKPPSSDIVKPSSGKKKKKGKRRRGGQPGHKQYERIPFSADKIDKIVKHEIRGASLTAIFAVAKPSQQYNIMSMSR